MTDFIWMWIEEPPTMIDSQVTTISDVLEESSVRDILERYFIRKFSKWYLEVSSVSDV